MLLEFINYDGEYKFWVAAFKFLQKNFSFSQ